MRGDSAAKADVPDGHPPALRHTFGTALARIEGVNRVIKTVNCVGYTSATRPAQPSHYQRLILLHNAAVRRYVITAEMRRAT